jgi:restriction system protein
MTDDPKKEPHIAPGGIVLSGDGMVAAAGQIGAAPSAALSGAGMVAAAGQIGVAVSVALSGAGVLAAAGEIRVAREIVSITVSSLIIPERKTTEGILVRSTSAIWSEIVQKLGSDWNLAFQLTSDQWEELIAGAFHKAGYEEVTKTPRSGDHGRDIIAIKHGFGCVKILGSVKAYKPDHLVEYDAVRALVGVVTADQKASKGIITTTSDFPPLMENDPSIAPFLPTRLELVDGKRLQQWLNELSNKST